ncbi:hypothetical protein ACQY1Q_09560 [Tenacibaculum sp. TC6]|uniref:hypothetical protein n=1 Tax=Tenacibaculum sp. TC6 TaxID=3423223 RepID=UPI003D36E81A
MVGFGGAVSAMITSLKNNKRERKNIFDTLDDRQTKHSGKLYFKQKATPEQLNEIRLKLKRENNINFLLNSALFIITLSLILFLIGFVIF